MNEHVSRIWSQLVDHGLVQGDEVELQINDTPWYVTVILAATGWVAAAFLLAAIVVAFFSILESKTLVLIVGFAFIALALFWLSLNKNDFLDNFALAFSLTGQVLVMFGLFRILGTNQTAALLCVAAMHAVLTLIAGNFIHRVLSSLFLTCTLVALVAVQGWPLSWVNVLLLPCAWLWLHEFDKPDSMQLRRSIGYGLALGLVLVNVFFYFDNVLIQLVPMRGAMAIAGTFPWLANGITGLVLIYVVWACLGKYPDNRRRSSAIAVFVPTVVVALIAIPAYGISLGLVLVLLAFVGSNRTLMGIGVVSLVVYIFSYYYLLDVTLLYKAIVLFVFGLSLLLSLVLLTHLFPEVESDNA